MNAAIFFPSRKQETLVHAVKLWAKKVSINNMYVDEFRGDPLFKTSENI